VTQNSVGEGEVLVISMTGKKVLEHRSSLRPEKGLLEWRSITKLLMGITLWEHYVV
jgi:hypothetical protein